MDPNANLAEQERIINNAKANGVVSVVSRNPRLRELRLALAEWMNRGGFEPDWTAAPNAAQYYGR